MPDQFLDAIKWIAIIITIAVCVDRIIKSLVDFVLGSRNPRR